MKPFKRLITTAVFTLLTLSAQAGEPDRLIGKWELDLEATLTDTLKAMLGMLPEEQRDQIMNTRGSVMELKRGGLMIVTTTLMSGKQQVETGRWEALGDTAILMQNPKYGKRTVRIVKQSDGRLVLEDPAMGSMKAVFRRQDD